MYDSIDTSIFTALSFVAPQVWVTRMVGLVTFFTCAWLGPCITVYRGCVFPRESVVAVSSLSLVMAMSYIGVSTMDFSPSVAHYIRILLAIPLILFALARLVEQSTITILFNCAMAALHVLALWLAVLSDTETSLRIGYISAAATTAIIITYNSLSWAHPISGNYGFTRHKNVAAAHVGIVCCAYFLVWLLSDPVTRNLSIHKMIPLPSSLSHLTIEGQAMIETAVDVFFVIGSTLIICLTPSSDVHVS